MDLAFTLQIEPVIIFSRHEDELMMQHQLIRFKYRRHDAIAYLLSPDNEIKRLESAMPMWLLGGSQLFFVLEKVERDQRLLGAIEGAKPNAAKIHQVCCDSANIVLRRLKTFANLRGLKEVSSFGNNPFDPTFKSVGIIENGEVIKEIPLKFEQNQVSGAPPGVVSVPKWDSARFAIEANLEVPPELECFENSRMHLECGNFRYALIEGVMAFELLLSKYLRSLLLYENNLLLKSRPRRQSEYKKLVESFLSPSFDLHKRMSALFPILAPKSVSSKVDVVMVLSCIKLRNDVVHLSNNRFDPSSRKTLVALYDAFELIFAEMQSATIEKRLGDSFNNAPYGAHIKCEYQEGSYLRVNICVSSPKETKTSPLAAALGPKKLPNDQTLLELVEFVAAAVESKLVRVIPGFKREKTLLVTFAPEYFLSDPVALWYRGKLKRFDQ